MLPTYFALSLLLCYSMFHRLLSSVFFFFNDTATTEIYTLSLHDALPISRVEFFRFPTNRGWTRDFGPLFVRCDRSEEHTSELQSLAYLVCRLLLEKKKKPLTPRTCSRI